MLVVSESDLKGSPKFISYHREGLERATLWVIQSLRCRYHALIYNRCRIDLRCVRYLRLELSVYGLLTPAWIVVAFLSPAPAFRGNLAFSLLLLLACLLLLGQGRWWCSCRCLFLLSTCWLELLLFSSLLLDSWWTHCFWLPVILACCIIYVRQFGFRATFASRLLKFRIQINALLAGCCSLLRSYTACTLAGAETDRTQPSLLVYKYSIMICFASVILRKSNRLTSCGLLLRLVWIWRQTCVTETHLACIVVLSGLPGTLVQACLWTTRSLVVKRDWNLHFFTTADIHLIQWNGNFALVTGGTRHRDLVSQLRDV